LPLLLDAARKAKETLYIAFIDYEKAYDKVNRQKLMDSLKQVGCGSRFLHALGESLIHTFNQLEEYLITTSQG
jgi:hypothetical protein